MKFLVCLVLIVAAASARRVPTGGRIVGGQETTIDKIPHQLVMMDNGSFFCGASIIGPQWVLTAAHCLDDYPTPASRISFRGGSTDRAEGGQVIRAAEYWIHPLYDPKVYPYDVAVVRLEEPFVFGPNITAARLPAVNEEVAPGSIVTVSGWGRAGLTLAPRILRSVDVPVITNTDCAAAWPGNIEGTMVCAGQPGKDSCNGDSGGPLTQDGTVVGVVSWGSLVCEDSSPGVYARTSNPSLRDFIFEKSGI